MKFSARMMSLASASALLLGLAAGCAPAAPKTTPTPAVTGSPAPVITAPIPQLDYIPQDIILDAMGMARDTSVLTVDGAPVTAEAVLYWCASLADQAAQYSGGAPLDWAQDAEGVTMKDYILENAVKTTTLYQVVENHAEDLGFGYNDENKATYQAELDTMKTQLAEQAGADDPQLSYAQWLGTIGLSDEGFAAVNRASYLFGNIRDGMYGAKGKEAPTDASMETWLEESGTLRAKHILVKAVASEDGKDDGMAAALEKTNSIRAELKAGGDTEKIFDELMKKYSEDVGAGGEQNCGPEGYTFGPGEMVQEFYDGTKALDVAKVSEPIKSDYGYHIILRLDGDTEAARKSYADDKTNGLVDGWMAEAKVEYTAAYDQLDPEVFYTKLGLMRTEIRDAIAPPEVTATPAPTETAKP